MLVLARKKLEQINLHTLDGVIVLTVLDYTGSRHKLGFEAPPTVKILRKEIDHEGGNRKE